MSEDRNGILDRLLEAYVAYYDVERVDSGDLVAIAVFHHRGECYLLVKDINMWSEEDHEYVYIYSGGVLDHTTLSEAIDHSLKDGTERIVPGRDHRCSSITTVLVYDSADESIRADVRRYSYHRSFKLMFHGWMEHRVVLVDLAAGDIVPSRRGRDVQSNLRRILGI